MSSTVQHFCKKTAIYCPSGTLWNQPDMESFRKSLDEAPGQLTLMMQFPHIKSTPNWRGFAPSKGAQSDRTCVKADAEAKVIGLDGMHETAGCGMPGSKIQVVPDDSQKPATDALGSKYQMFLYYSEHRSCGHKMVEWDQIGVREEPKTEAANLLVMVAIYVNRRFHFPIYYLMANLAAADFFAGLAYFYLMFNTGPNTRRLTVSTWLLRQGLIDTSLTASVANLLAIAIERHITVFRMQLHTRMSNRRVVVVIVVIWTMAIVMGAIPSVGWNCICDLEHCSNMAPLYSDSYLVFWAIFNLVTFVVMVVLYAHIFVYVRQRTMRMSRHSSGPRRNRDTMMSLLKTVVIVLGLHSTAPEGQQEIMDRYCKVDEAVGYYAHIVYDICYTMQSCRHSGTLDDERKFQTICYDVRFSAGSLIAGACQTLRSRNYIARTSRIVPS
ncbi:unnamed protein product [Ranitomeya imitator]|uniref:G-protein coupled receptors family 1 profile domain-containing protein n=1 Tax=Ranitomeya imitator TaxID=111125 RepID=A0ABN9LDY0_9NEOB|nr:unnamed protein product [Ranitomeya imitator]